MQKSYPRGMKAQWWIANARRRRPPELLAGEVNRVATHRKPQMPEMDTDLIRAPGQRPRFEQIHAISKAAEHTKFGARFQSVLRVHSA